LSSNSQKSQQDEGLSERYVVIGKVVSVNVLRRELRIVPETSHPERFHQLRDLHVRTKEGSAFLLRLHTVRVTRKAVIARVEGRDDSELASTRGAFVVVPHSDRFPLPEHEYYIDDLIGLTVRDTTGEIVGRLTEIWTTPANDIYRVVDGKGRETLLPAVEDVIIKVDVKGGEVIADISNLS
jgi:16S rRNA processing protein RimM